MKINFTKREYRLLLEMMYLADWMLHAHEPGSKKDPYHALEQKILSLAREFGCEDLVEHSAHLNEYCPTQAFEEADTIRGCIEDYDDATFWDELISRLAERDVFRKHTAEELARMTGEDRIALSWRAEESYADEFKTNGLERIKIE
ncbi:MAG: hypothetical protein GX803_05315 [Lentisphaerae bacterium]|jgi:hypothetical protein|nr:hypothetical protein [Lentisphaerota bacterium]